MSGEADWRVPRTGSLVLRCGRSDELLRTWNAMVGEVGPELAKRVSRVLGDYIWSFGRDGAYERVNGRTIAQILSEYRPSNVESIASGEVDGLRYELFDAPADASGGEDGVT